MVTADPVVDDEEDDDEDEYDDEEVGSRTSLESLVQVACLAGCEGQALSLALWWSVQYWNLSAAGTHTDLYQLSRDFGGVAYDVS